MFLKSSPGLVLTAGGQALVSFYITSSLGLPLGLEAPVMTPNGVNFLFFSSYITSSLCVLAFTKSASADAVAHPESQKRRTGAKALKNHTPADLSAQA